MMMNQYLNLDSGLLKRRNCLWTAREIAQQPGVWRACHSRIDAGRGALDAWLQPMLETSGVQVLLCGAGTSAFIGDTAAAWLQKSYRGSAGCRFTSVGTTELVADPLQYLSRDVPTLMISFARSGDSPESLACVRLADQLLSNCRHLIMTCNPGGGLAGYAASNDDALCLTMPAETNDRSFAMTSSYTAMLVSCVAVFTPDRSQLEFVARWTEQLLDGGVDDIRTLSQRDFSRLVVLGAGCLAGTAAEAALKCLELTAGRVVAVHWTPLAFRHGPKSVIDDATVVVLLRSTDTYTGRYDRDLLSELRSDGRSAAVLELSPVTVATGNAMPAAAEWLDDVWASLVYVVCCQMLAFHKAMALGVEADRPCPTGEVNRVVNGVTIYPFGEAPTAGKE